MDPREVLCCRLRRNRVLFRLQCHSLVLHRKLETQTPTRMGSVWRGRLSFHSVNVKYTE